MPRPQIQQPESGSRTPSNWESTPWSPEDRVVDEPLRLSAREEPMRLDDDHVIDLPLDGDSIRRA
jgi:hypothetical protein